MWVPIRRIGAVVAGNGLAFYDFLVYAFFASQIGKTFFPSTNASSSLLLSLATFGAGYMMRPLGGVIIGSLGDRMGRKPAMLVSFGLLGAAILGLVITPSYASIGIAAPILVLALRLIQGFAIGGDVGPTTAYLVEAAPAASRGLYASLQGASVNFAVCCAGLVGLVLSSTLTEEELTVWGWRIAFLIGLVIVPVGWIARKKMDETLPATRIARTPTTASTMASTMRTHWRLGVLGIMLFGSSTVASYIMGFMVTYSTSTLHMSSRVAFCAIVTTGLFGMAFRPLSGWLSDRRGRKPVMIFGAMALLAAIFPSFATIIAFHTAPALLGATAALSVLIALIDPPTLVAVTESLPQHVRSGGLGLTYAVTIAIFGGTTQFAVAWLLASTGNAFAPAWYMAAAVVLGLIGMVMMPETAPAKLNALALRRTIA